VKNVLYWCRWVGLAPAFLVGAGLGPGSIFVCLSHFPSLLDFYGMHMATAQYVVSALGWVSSSFGVTLICAWVAPKSKYIVAISAGLLCTLSGLILMALGGRHGGELSVSFRMLFMFGSYALGICLGLVCLFWILSRRSISN
jgi:hypothetical protein